MAAVSPQELDAAGRALGAWPHRAIGLEPLGSGLINQTFAVETDEGRFVLQRVNPVFHLETHANILAVTEHLASLGRATPRLSSTKEGTLYSVQEGSVWRLMTRVEGESLLSAPDTNAAFQAGALLGQFHRDLASLQHDFVGLRTGVHDTDAHLQALRHAVATNRGHPLWGKVQALALELLEAARRLPRLPQTESLTGHGDPKLDNLLFSAVEPRQAVCWVDLDTVGPASLASELGDAWRSWCNPRGEGASQARFDLELFEASLLGYLSSGPRPRSEHLPELLHGPEWITLELAARFLRDALEERYFAWDARAFPRRGEHNLARARAQAALLSDLLAQRRKRRELLATQLG